MHQRQVGPHPIQGGPANSKTSEEPQPEEGGEVSERRPQEEAVCARHLQEDKEDRTGQLRQGDQEGKVARQSNQCLLGAARESEERGREERIRKRGCYLNSRSG